MIKDVFVEMRKKGKLWYLSELIPLFQKTKIFMFANGGSVANLKDLQRLKNYNLFTVHNGIYYYCTKFGFTPNIWLIRLFNYNYINFIIIHVLFNAFVDINDDDL